jgi:four helix bundle protein
MCQTPSTPASVAPATDTAPALDAERLDVFHVSSARRGEAPPRSSWTVAFGDASVELYGLVPQLLERADRNLRDQLERASSSVTLNICEGAARRAPREKAHFFAIARGSAAESAAIVHLLLSRGRVSILEAKRARALVVRIVAMLTRLEQRFRQCP